MHLAKRLFLVKTPSKIITFMQFQTNQNYFFFSSWVFSNFCILESHNCRFEAARNSSLSVSLWDSLVFKCNYLGYIHKHLNFQNVDETSITNFETFTSIFIFIQYVICFKEQCFSLKTFPYSIQTYFKYISYLK